MKEISINASKRELLGKGPARQSRMAGNIPAVVYGPELEPIPVDIDLRTFRSAMKGSASLSSIISLDVGGKVNKVILRDIQRDPITSEIIHMDFHAISMTKPLHISIPIHFKGTPRGVKTDGGIMQITMRELEISCLPTNIPEEFVLDVEGMGIGDAMHVRDISLENIQIVSPGQRTIVVIAAPTVVKSDDKTEAELEAEAEAEAEATPAEGAVADSKEAHKDDKHK
jgi:large subunit ribosomal protein L25